MSGDPPPRLRRRRVRAVLRWTSRVVVVALIPVTWSYANALTGPGNDSYAARTVEWARDHHLGGVIDQLERWWFARHQAPVGGTPDLAAGPAVAVAAVPSTVHRVPASSVATSAVPTASTSSPTTTPGATAAATTTPATTTSTTIDPGPAHLAAPAPLVSPAAEPVPGEGEWTPFGPTVEGVPGAYITSIRPDAKHTSVLDAVIWIDPGVFSLRQYPGLKTPGGPWDRPTHVEADRTAQLVAAFAGGFRFGDSHGGVMIGHRVLQKLRDGAASFAISDDGVPQIGAWGTDVVDDGHLDSVRQNLDLIVVDGAPVPDLASDPNDKWGFTGPDNRSAVWRSGVGIRADGALVWVGGDGLTIQTLADTLVRAGAIRGMQLEINREWVQLNTYSVGPDGQVHGTLLLRGMEHTGDRWLTEDTRDFFAVFARPSVLG